ncbi:MAG TPA: GNAT family protein [Ktedonobacterales bacterium]|jgi:RimJ/RimL family protein N-acetyltransferase|nr:GNAT family protein [Ktedonobacterales bacterium]
MQPIEFTTIETARLRLRRFGDADLPAFIAYRNDPDVARYQSWDGISEAEAVAFVREQQTAPAGEPGEGLQIAVERKDSGRLIGDCFFKVVEDDPRQAEIGYTLAREAQGHGFATEAVAALLTWAFPTFDLHRVIAITDVKNTASVALLERLGLRREAHFRENIWFKGAWGDEYLYAILRDEWSGARQASTPGTDAS